MDQNAARTVVTGRGEVAPFENPTGSTRLASSVVADPASKTSPLDGLSDRMLGLDGTIAGNLNYSTHSAYLSPNHLCEQVVEKMSH